MSLGSNEALARLTECYMALGLVDEAQMRPPCSAATSRTGRVQDACNLVNNAGLAPRHQITDADVVRGPRVLNHNMRPVDRMARSAIRTVPRAMCTVRGKTFGRIKGMAWCSKF